MKLKYLYSFGGIKGGVTTMEILWMILPQIKQN